ncbi:glycosyltransferase [Microbacterium sp. SD291]|uniref:CgeB family protein n=1 Tax=Microbacterium sp. SD291 TaxID=2782007 RepID=UPI001A966DC7|nr:glycosyltransferase [Microbacterium sp. SD291]MBO0981012.1 glycosyltransferase family 1 protein [Microbacterium sp. SD291]
MNVLVVSPGFHGYASALGRTFASLGYDARVHVYDHARHVGERLGLRSLQNDPSHPLALAARARITQRAIRTLREYRPDAVVVVRGDLLAGDWQEALQASGARHITWFYDELRRMTYSPTALREIGAIATYSADDQAAMRAEGIDAHHVPLGYDALAEITPHAVDAVTLIGARYPGRESTLRNLSGSGVRVKAFGRDWSRHPLDQIRTGAFADPGVPVGRQLDRSTAYGAMRDSSATLNLHGDQDGFTMRTFEASGVGAVQLCDRLDVDGLYDLDSEVIAYRDEDELVEYCHRIETDARWATGIRERGRTRTLAEHTLAHRLRRLEQLWD